jgi:photosystem II stability/assembly factor-like uncharacterized protein
MRTQRRSTGFGTSLHLVALLVFFAALGMTPAAAFATGDVVWTQRDSGTTTSNLQSVFFTDANTGWAVGQAGYVRKTIDGGKTWVAQTTSTFQINGVYFFDANHGWCVGGTAGTLCETSNGGTTWSAVNIAALTTFSAVHMYDAGTGWIVGGAGTIMKVTGNGGTYDPQVSHTSAGLKSVHFFDANTGWVVGDSGTIIKTIDGGTTWTGQTSGVSAQDLNGVDFVDASTGWAVGTNGTIIKTINGGTTWTAQTSGTNAHLYSVKFANANYGWAVGASGTIRRTTNGGTTWTAQDSGVSVALRSVYFADTEHGCAVGDSGTILQAKMPVYRFYNMRTGSHFYTADAVEKANVQANLSATYHYDGIAYSVNTLSADNSSPLWRFYNMRTGAHFYTADPAEKANLLANMTAVYHYDGPAYNVCLTNVAGCQTVWRFYNLRNQTHFYTADTTEKAMVQNTMQSTYHLDGPAFYLAP